jgi:hypothetical protein
MFGSTYSYLRTLRFAGAQTVVGCEVYKHLAPLEPEHRFQIKTPPVNHYSSIRNRILNRALLVGAGVESKSFWPRS